MPRPFAALLIDTPSSSRLSPISSPGWGGFFISMVLTSLMIVHKINVRCLATLKSENNSPVCAHGHRPKAFEVARQGMKPEGYDIDVGNFFAPHGSQPE